MTAKEYSDLYRLLKKYGEEAKEKDSVGIVSKCVSLAEDVQGSFDALGGDAPIWAYKVSGLGRKTQYTDIEEKVLALHRDGMSLRHIADRCGCSTRPVRDIIARSQGKAPVTPVIDIDMSQLTAWVESKEPPKEAPKPKRKVAHKPKTKPVEVEEEPKKPRPRKKTEDKGLDQLPLPGLEDLMPK